LSSPFFDVRQACPPLNPHLPVMWNFLSPQESILSLRCCQPALPHAALYFDTGGLSRIPPLLSFCTLGRGRSSRSVFFAGVPPFLFSSFPPHPDTDCLLSTVLRTVFVLVVWVPRLRPFSLACCVLTFFHQHPTPLPLWCAAASDLPSFPAKYPVLLPQIPHPWPAVSSSSASQEVSLSPPLKANVFSSLRYAFTRHSSFFRVTSRQEPFSPTWGGTVLSSPSGFFVVLP